VVIRNREPEPVQYNPVIRWGGYNITFTEWQSRQGNNLDLIFGLDNTNDAYSVRVYRRGDANVQRFSFTRQALIDVVGSDEMTCTQMYAFLLQMWDHHNNDREEIPF